nr:unnamed protein product [Callosobruchus chinensis]
MGKNKFRRGRILPVSIADLLGSSRNEDMKNLRLTEDWAAQDWKTSISKAVKNPESWHFKFNPAKTFIITKLPTNNVLVRGEVNYKSDLGMDKSVLKRGQKISFLGLNTMNPGRVSHKKKADNVANLLQLHFGADWRCGGRLDFYKRAIESATMENDTYNYQKMYRNLKAFMIIVIYPHLRSGN